MLTRTFIEKTLLDIGGLAVDEESSTANLWQLYVYKKQNLTAALHTESGAMDDFYSVDFEFNNSIIQQKVKSLFRSNTSNAVSILRITKDSELEELCTCISQVLDQLPSDFDVDESQEFDPALDKKDTETEALKKERRGQDKYRKRLEQLWDSRCAVTGISIPEVLRASHAKPWKDCETGRERLDPYNGFLLTANLDALFDKFLITFTSQGKIKISRSLCTDDLAKLGISQNMQLRFIHKRHIPYLIYHNSIFEFIQSK